MFLWASLARYAKHAKLIRVLFIFFAVQSLLTIPVGISMVRDSPDIFYPRIHGGPVFENFDSTWVDYINVIEDEQGFVSTLSILSEDENTQSNNHREEQTIQPVTVSTTTGRVDETNEHDTVYRVTLAADYTLINDDRFAGCDFMFAITPQFIFYRDINSQLIIPTTLVSAWALEEGDLREIFNHLALYNSYFSSIVAPVFLLVFVIMLAAQAVMLLAAVWLFGQWVKLSGTMTVRERFSVCTFASVPAGLISFAAGLFVPVIHVFIAQLLMIYFSYKAMKEYLSV